MKKVILTGLFLIISVCAYAGLNIGIIAGQKHIDSGDLKPADTHFTKGLRFDIGDPAWFANIAFDYYFSEYNEIHFLRGSMTDVDTRTEEMRIGFRQYFGKKPRAFIGLGVANMSLSRKELSETSKRTCSGSTGINLFTNGVWGELGVDFPLSNFFSLGVAASYSDGHIKCNDGSKVEIGGISGGITAGFNW